jgi:hypothetical protein
MMLGRYTVILRIAVAWGVLAVLGQGQVEAGLSVNVSIPGDLQLEIGEGFPVILEARLPLGANPGAGATLFTLERDGRARLNGLFTGPSFSDENLGYSWLVIEEGHPSITREPSGIEGALGVLVARSTWTLASLEAGSRELPSPTWSGDESTSFAASETGPVAVAPSLAEGEDEARTLAGFTEPPPLREPAPSHSPLLYAVPVGALILLAGFLIGRRTKAASPQSSKRQRAELKATLAELRVLASPAQKASKDDLRAAAFQLTWSLRAAVELNMREAAGEVQRGAQDGLTDSEWCEAVGASVTLATLFEDASEVKYAGQTATAWWLAERLELVDSVLNNTEAAGTSSGEEGSP